MMPFCSPVLFSRARCPRPLERSGVRARFTPKHNALCWLSLGELAKLRTTTAPHARQAGVGGSTAVHFNRTGSQLEVRVHCTGMSAAAGSSFALDVLQGTAASSGEAARVSFRLPRDKGGGAAGEGGPPLSARRKCTHHGLSPPTAPAGQRKSALVPHAIAVQVPQGTGPHAIGCAHGL